MPIGPAKGPPDPPRAGGGGPSPSTLTRILAEPTVHFFIIGALLFVAHRLVVGNPRVVVVTPGVRAELARRFKDNNDGRPPTPSELDRELGAWERDEALYREALRAELDRNDATIRTVLADRVRARVAVGIPKRAPSQADLDRWLATHHSLYETPRRYDYATVVFPKADPSAAAARERFQRAVTAGADPTSLGRPLVGGDLTANGLEQRLGPTLAARIQALPIGRWQPLESERDLLLARVNAVDGGLPGADQLHKRLVADWMYADQKQAVDRAVQAIVDRYHFEEQR